MSTRFAVEGHDGDGIHLNLDDDWLTGFNRRPLPLKELTRLDLAVSLVDKLISDSRPLKQGKLLLICHVPNPQSSCIRQQIPLWLA